MSKEINLKNIRSFIKGNARKYMNKYNMLSLHIQEQVTYRLNICKDTCVKNGKCQKCGCSLPGKAFDSPSCNRNLFPDMMNKDQWDQYKAENKIKI